MTTAKKNPKESIEDILNLQMAVAAYEVGQLNKLMVGSGVKRSARRQINRSLIQHAEWNGIAEFRKEQNERSREEQEKKD
jgi:hypothetical protein